MQYPLSTSVIASSACAFAFGGYPTCAQTSTTASLCISDDISNWESTCAYRSPSANPLNFASPMSITNGNVDAINLNLFNCAGEGLYYLNYCTTNMCNTIGAVSSAPSPAGSCSNSPSKQWSTKFEKALGEAIGGAIIAAIVVPIVVVVLIVVLVARCCCHRKTQLVLRLQQPQVQLASQPQVQYVMAMPQPQQPQHVVQIAPAPRRSN